MIRPRLITLLLRPDDAEPILRESARLAATYSAYLDHITLKTWNSPGRNGEKWEDTRKRWKASFLRHKRIVESFGLDYEQTSEAETMTVEYPYVGGSIRTRKIPGIGVVNERVGDGPDYKNPQPAFRKGVHSEACEHAADRVVRRWRQTIGTM